MKNLCISIKYYFLLSFTLLVSMIIGCASSSSPDEDKEILAWSQEAVLATFSYDYANYHQQLEAASQYFIPQTWKFYFTALNASSGFKKVLNQKMVVSAVVQKMPVIISEGVNTNSQPSWTVQVPAVITYENASVHIQKPVIISVGILRTKNQVGVRGLAISELSVKEQEEGNLKDWHSK